MAQFMMVMKGTGAADAWQPYIATLSASGMFRGGSALGNGECFAKSRGERACVVTGFMRFEADHIEQVRALITGNPVYEAGGEVELLELVED